MSEKEKTQTTVPEPFRDDKEVKTTTRKMSDVIKEKLAQITDLATLEILLPIETRMKHRLESIHKLSRAKNIRVRDQWKTTPPQMYITNLKAQKISNGEIEISFGVYEIDEKGNKKLYSQMAEFMDRDGNMRRREVNAEYRVAYDVIELIRTGKQIKREVIYHDNEVK